jgi:hypothetical protein
MINRESFKETLDFLGVFMRIEIYKGLNETLYDTIDNLSTFCAARDRVILKLELGGKQNPDLTPVVLPFEEAIDTWKTVSDRGSYSEWRLLTYGI